MRKFLLYLFFLPFTLPNYGQVTTVPHPRFETLKTHDLSGYQLFQDTTKSISFAVVSSSRLQSKFRDYSSAYQSATTRGSKVIWARLQLQCDQQQEVYFTAGHAEKINLYAQYPDGKIIEQSGGMLVPTSRLTDPKLISTFKIFLPAGSVVDLYVRLQNSNIYPMSVAATLTDFESYWRDHHFAFDKVLYFFLGGLLIMIFYNLLLFITAGDKTYFFYVLYMLSILIIHLLNGRFYEKLFPSLGEYPFALQIVDLLVTQLIGVLYVFFVRSFINLPKYAPQFDAWLKVWFKLRGISIPIILLLTYVAKINLTIVAVITDIFMACILLVVVYKTRHKIAKYFVWGASVLLLGVSLTLLELYNIFLFGQPTNGIPMQIGILSELILFSVGLGIRVKLSELDKRNTERQLLNQFQENEKLQSKVTRELEQKVEQRTTEIQKRNTEITMQNIMLVGQKEELEVQSEAIKKTNEELNIKNDELQVSFEKLKIAQGELVQSEKMASLGQLTAGIAHEINNPINFVSANIHPLKNDFAEIKDLFHRYEKLHDAPEDCTEALTVIKKVSSEMDTPYLFEEIDMLLNGIEEGAFRTREIVLGLRNFSRLEENNFKPANIHAGLESTLMLIQGKIKNKITINKQYTLEIPMIECIPGKINQVFMNVLNNAAQAIPGKGEINISTKQCKDQVIISIKDSGSGMTPEIKEKIFEPFFTTKDIGKGTGLGLSISYGIIEDHHGKIEVKSEVGKGSEFIISLPVRQLK